MRRAMAPLETVEELLLVRGVTPDLLFGRDINRNGMVDSHEQGAPSPSRPTSEGAMDRGWSAYLTLFSQERNVSPSRRAADLAQSGGHGDAARGVARRLQRQPRDGRILLLPIARTGPFTGDDDKDDGRRRQRRARS